MPEVDPVSVKAVIRDVVDTEILPRFRTLTTSQIRQKSEPGDLVTEADLQAEAVLSSRLTSLLPGSEVIGEEAVFLHPERLALLQDRVPVWIIDPVDGTGNFVRGTPRFACIVALVVDGVTRMGWIDSCVDRETACVIKGEGVFRDNGTRISCFHARTTDALEPSLLRGQAGGQAIRRALKPLVHQVDWVGSAAQTYLDLLEGRIDFAAFSKLKVWDHAAGTLMVNEAGGVARLGDGRPYTPMVRQSPNPLIVASSERIWKQVADLLQRALHSPCVQRHSES